MLYDRKVKYLDYFEGGMRVRGGGFAKLEARDGTLRVELSVTGLHHTDTFVRDVMLCGREREEICGRIEIAAGRGQYRQQWRNLENMGGTGISYGELCGLRIPLGAGREVSCRWQAGGTDVLREAHDAGQRAAEAVVNGGREASKAGEGTLETVTAEAEGVDREEGTLADGRKELAEPAASGGRTALGMDNRENFRQEAYSGETMRKNESTEHTGERMPQGEPVFKDALREKALEEGGYGNGRVMADRAEDAPDKDEIDEIWPGEEFRERAKQGHRGGELQGSSVRRSADGGQGIRKEAGNMAEGVTREGGEAYRGTERRQASDGKDAGGGHGRTSVDWVEHDDRSRKPAKLMEDKWQQLWAIYPHIRPFQDAREYLSIGPSDFVLFSEDSYKAVNNSFLLHGYYNYHHLLLARMEQRGENCYYIGVPGNFYEREKQVAIMFGFESFECAEEPAQAGDFGYYMMRAEI